MAHSYPFDDNNDPVFALVTQHKTPIIREEFEHLLDQFKNCSNFIVEIQVEGDNLLVAPTEVVLIFY